METNGLKPQAGTTIHVFDFILNVGEGTLRISLLTEFHGGVAPQIFPSQLQKLDGPDASWQLGSFCSLVKKIKRGETVSEKSESSVHWQTPRVEEPHSPGAFG